MVQNQKTYERFKNELICDVDDKFLEDIQQNAYSLSFDVDKISEEFDKPTLILLGKQDDCVGYKDAWNILENYPRATFAILDRAGHSLQIEQENLFNSLINDWLIRVNEEIIVG